MFFQKNEVIELSGGKKHIVVDYTNYKGTYYYYVCELNPEGKRVIDKFRVITTENENGCLFVKTAQSDLKVILEQIFKKQLKID